MKKRLSRKKSLTYYTIMAILIFISIELASQVTVFALARTSSAFQNWEGFISQRGYSLLKGNEHSYHPYLAFYNKPDPQKETTVKEPGVFRIAIIGASFADMFANYLVDHQEELLPPITVKRNGSSIPLRFTVINFAVGSYRQPQQAIASFLNMEQADLFMSFEGFNEVVLTHFTCLPEDWPRYISSSVPEARSPYSKWGELHHSFYRGLHRAATSGLASARIIYFTFGPLIVRASNWLEHKHNKYTQRSCREREDQDYIAGIHIRNWMRDLHKQHLLFKNSDSQIYTFFQPNQYYEGSKTWSPEERLLFSITNSQTSKQVNAYYPLARRYFNELAKDHPHLVDLTMMFEHHSEQIYKDECCHVGDYGNALIFEKIKPYIMEAVQNAKEP